MTIFAPYKGLNLMIADNDIEFQGFYEAAKQHKLVMQKCGGCNLLRYPPGCACPWCQSVDYTWQEVSGKGTIYSYQIVTQAILPGFADWVPYPIVLVELDEQAGTPTEHEALRMITNLVRPDGSPEPEGNVAIGKRVEITFIDVTEDFSLPMFRLSPEAPKGPVWQFAH